ncbi:hypothetical protein D3C81_2033660 [compost metagenome]
MYRQRLVREHTRKNQGQTDKPDESCFHVLSSCWVAGSSEKGPATIKADGGGNGHNPELTPTEKARSGGLFAHEQVDFGLLPDILIIG